MLTGHCFCKGTSFRFKGPPNWSGYCHCDDCRRNCAAPVTAWLGVTEADFEWTGEPPQVFHSSPGVRRHFCGTCGTPMAFQADHYPVCVNLYAPTLADPDDFQPQFHLNWSSRLTWITVADDLPKCDTTLLDAEIKAL